jgi:hypothetical protein
MNAAKTLTRCLLCAAMGVSGAGLTASAYAHDDAYFDSHPSAHGGQTRMSGPFHLELVSAPSGVLVYITDHASNAIPTAGWHAQAVVLGAGKKTRIELKPAGSNTLRGNGFVPGDAKVVVTVKPRAGEEYNARFTPKPGVERKP